MLTKFNIGTDETKYLSCDKQSVEIINDLTIKTMEDSKHGKNLIKFDSLKEMFDECWTDKVKLG